MKKIVAALSIALLTACATKPPPVPSTANVMPRVYVVAPEGDRLIVVNPDYIRVTPGAVQTIVWQLKTSGYTFADDNAISGFTPMLHGTGASQQLSAPAGNQFGCGKLSATMFQCQYQNQQLGRYKYLVTLKADDGNDPPPIDPAVGND